MSKEKTPLTQSAINKLSCPPGRKAIQYPIDPVNIPGLLVECRYSGSKTFFLRYRDRDNRTRYCKLARSMDASLSDVKKRALQIRRDIFLGNFPNRREEKAQCMTWNELFDIYIDYARPRKKSWRDDQKLHNRRLRARYGDHSIDSIDLRSVEQFLGELAEEGLAASSVRHHGQLLKRCMSLAVTWKLLNSNPLAELKLQQVHDAREYFLSPDELQRLLHVLNTDSATVPCLAAKLLLFTGLRVGELMQCQWQDLSLESPTPQLKVVKEHSKNGRARYVPLSEEAIKVINQLPSKGKSDYLFTNSRNGERLLSIDKVWQRLRKEAELPQLRLHDLRHNFASMLISSGESLYTVQRILGHQSADQSSRYSHLSDEAAQNAVNSVSGYLEKTLNGKNGS